MNALLILCNAMNSSGFNLCGGTAVEDGLDVQSEIPEARVTDAGLALDADAEARLGATLSETDQEHQDVVISRAHSGRRLPTTHVNTVNTHASALTNFYYYYNRFTTLCPGLPGYKAFVVRAGLMRQTLLPRKLTSLSLMSDP